MKPDYGDYVFWDGSIGIVTYNHELSDPTLIIERPISVVFAEGKRRNFKANELRHVDIQLSNNILQEGDKISITPDGLDTLEGVIVQVFDTNTVRVLVTNRHRPMHVDIPKPV